MQLEQDGHGVGCGVFHIALQVGVQLPFPRYAGSMPSQQVEPGADAPLGQHGLSDAEALGVEQPLNGIFKDAGDLRFKALQLASLQIPVSSASSSASLTAHARGNGGLTSIWLQSDSLRSV